MAPFRTPGCVRLVATYERDGARSSMQFWFLVAGRPTTAQCENLARTYIIWDQDGVPGGFPFRLFRTTRSNLVDITVSSVDALSAASYTADRHDGLPVQGINGATALTSAVAPRIEWDVLDPPFNHRYRTYVPCLCADALDGLNTDRVSDAFLSGGASLFQGIGDLAAAAGTGQQVVVCRYQRGIPQNPMPVGLVIGAHVDARKLGIQSRRLEAP